MKTYFQCVKCQSYEEVEKAFFTPSDTEEESPMCKGCFYDHQDRLAYNESEGEFTNYEDWMESMGATIAYSEDKLGREL